MTKYQKILIERYKYHNERAMMTDLSGRAVAIHSHIKDEIQAIYYLMFKRNLVKDITMNGEI